MRIKSSYIWAVFFALAIVVWLGSGQLSTNSTASPQSADSAKNTKAELFRVEVRSFKARERRAHITARGQTAAARLVEVRNRTAGIIESVAVSGGDLVKRGDVVCKLDKARKVADLARAKAELVSAERDYNAAKELAKKQFSSVANVTTLKAKSDSAKAALVWAETELQWSNVLAPVSGVIAEQPAEQGFFMQTGQVCARIAIMDPIKITAQVGERDINAVKLGNMARAELVTGQKLTGKITFVSPISDLNTRTFKVEIEAPNPQRAVKAGITASLHFDLPAMQAHLLPAYLVSLNDVGEIGVRSLTAANTVKFIPVKLIQHTRDGLWVSGLPQEVNLITAGQDYVLDGQKVDPVFADPAAAGS